MKCLLLIIFVAAIFPATTRATGILLPKDKSLPALAIQHQRVSIDVKDGVATAKIEQVFKNSVNRQLEATYVFPLPADASIGEFAMYINGKKQAGELVEAGKARKIYEDIVRRMRDPGLLEYMDGQLLKMRVFPIPANGEQRIEISYTQQLKYEGGTYQYVYPLRTTKAASRTLEDFTIGVNIDSKVPIKTIYSPTHEIGISRKGENRAVIGFEEYQSLLDRDFVLYYGVSEKRFGLNLLTHAEVDKDGYFMMMLAPQYDKKDMEIIARDVVFVVDTSGSMAGEKIRQAREALDYCVKKLNAGDRFNVLRFSTDVDAFKPELVKVSEESRREALGYIKNFEARGGTDIAGSLQAALKMRTDERRPFTIIFLTDGKPTIGETEPATIMKQVNALTADRTRIFVFGVGEQVNTHLLDQIGADTGGYSQYVRPNEDIETEVSAFYDKASNPVLSQPALEVRGLKVLDVYPRKLDDLFHGAQLTLFGRYQGEGDHAVILKGEINGNPREFVYEYNFPKKAPDSEFITRLWATRKVGFLLDQIRLQGEEAELKDEVIRLSQEFGIMTPYTSFLVLETDQDYARNDISREQQARLQKHNQRRREEQRAAIEKHGNWSAPAWSASAPAAARSPRNSAGNYGQAFSDDSDSAMEHAVVPMFGGGGAGADGMTVTDLEAAAGSPGKKAFAEHLKLKDTMASRTGRDALDVSEAIADYKRADAPDINAARQTRKIGEKLFTRVNGVWIDSGFKKEMPLAKITCLSDEYFALLADHPEIARFLALGDRIIFTIEGKTAISIVP